MAVKQPNRISIYRPTGGASGAYTAGATMYFMSRDYSPAVQPRDIEFDYVHNQNGRFKYVYDNGPGFKNFKPFTLVLDDAWAPAHLASANATTQYSNLLSLWNYIGILTLNAMDGSHQVVWAQSALEKAFGVFPHAVGDKIEYRIVVQFEEVA